MSNAKSANPNRSVIGPFDKSEVNTEVGYVDFGAILLPSADQLQIRLEIEDSTERIIALSIDIADSVLQLQAFAAPKTEGVWAIVRDKLKSAVVSQGGTANEVIGSFGDELLTAIPLKDEKGKIIGERHARFIGVDGPRWFLRGVIGGAAINDPATAVIVDSIFRKVVVDRGDAAVPPRDLLPLQLPAGVVLPPRK